MSARCSNRGSAWTELGQILLTTIDGRACSLAGFAGKVLLIVNTASRCGFTPQYAGLEALHRQFGPRGFAVLGFPLQPVRASGTRQQRRDCRVLQPQLPAQLSLVRAHRGQRRARPPAVPPSQAGRARRILVPKPSNGTSPSSSSIAALGGGTHYAATAPEKLAADIEALL